LRAGRRELIESLLPAVSLDLALAADAPAKCFPGTVSNVWLEVGFGAGEHLAEIASAHPEIGFIGCEVFVNGVASLLSRLVKSRATGGPDNVRIFPDDARQVIVKLPAASVGRVFVLFPDPWPKKRHNRRRFLSPPQLDELARIMQPGAELRIATDHMGYLRWILFYLLRHDAFEWIVRTPAEWRERPPEWPATRYEQKAKEAGRHCVYLRFRRRSVGPVTQKSLVAGLENA
jgi:tRNA (guanine-N7-)-methyltransferase